MVDAERVGSIEEKTALTTDVLLVRAGTTGAGGAVHGGGVSPALGRGVSPQPDVAVLAPARAPAVPNYPVSTIRVGAIAHELDSVVKSDVGVI